MMIAVFKGRGRTIWLKLGVVVCVSVLAGRCSLPEPSAQPADEEGALAPLPPPIVAEPKLELAAQSQAVDDEAPETEYFLLLGLDRTRRGVGRTDTIMILAFNHEEKRIGVVSVPRDLLVDIPHLEPGRINKVYRVGEREFGQGEGILMLTQVVEDVFGIEIRHAVAVDFSGFIKTVDLLRGIPVNVACPLEDCFWLDGDKGDCKRLVLAAGRQRMNGETALLYARSRHGRSDVDRTRRQQAVLLGLWERLTEFDSLIKLPVLWWELRHHVTSTAELSDIPHIVELASSVRVDALFGMVLKPPAVTPHYLPDGKYVLLPDKEKIAESLDKLFTSSLPGTSSKLVCKKKDAALTWRADRAVRLRRAERPQGDAGVGNDE